MFLYSLKKKLKLKTFLVDILINYENHNLTKLNLLLLMSKVAIGWNNNILKVNILINNYETFVSLHSEYLSSIEYKQIYQEFQ